MYARVCVCVYVWPTLRFAVMVFVYICIIIYIGTGTVPGATSRTTVFFYYFVFPNVHRTQTINILNASIYYYNIMIIVIIRILCIDNVTASAVVSFVSILSFTLYISSCVWYCIIINYRWKIFTTYIGTTNRIVIYLLWFKFIIK